MDRILLVTSLGLIMFILTHCAKADPLVENIPGKEKKHELLINGEGIATLLTGYPAQEYSGITWLGDNRYAVVTDKKDGFYEFTFDIHVDGSIRNIERSFFHGDSMATRDCEDIIWHPVRETFFISGEADQEIIEYDPDGSKTGNNLNIQLIFKQNRDNYGFEPLGYDAHTNLFWTTTEGTLIPDGEIAAASSPIANLHRIQSFDGSTLQPAKQFAYKADPPVARSGKQMMVKGIPAITALPDGRLFILEREFFLGQDETGGGVDIWVEHKLYLVDPEEQTDITEVADLRTLNDTQFMTKQLLWTKRTAFADPDNPLANFEGMCLGPVLEDGSHTLILINDAQGGMMSIMKEYLLVLKFTYKGK